MSLEPIACPVCGNAEWEEAPQAFLLRESNPQIIRGGGTEVTGTFCTRCGFVRLHRAGTEGSSGESPTH